MKSLSKATFHLLCCILLLGTFQSCKDDETTPPPPRRKRHAHHFRRQGRSQYRNFHHHAEKCRCLYLYDQIRDGNASSDRSGSGRNQNLHIQQSASVERLYDRGNRFYTRRSGTHFYRIQIPNARHAGSRTRSTSGEEPFIEYGDQRIAAKSVFFYKELDRLWFFISPLEGYDNYQDMLYGNGGKNDYISLSFTPNQLNKSISMKSASEIGIRCSTPCRSNTPSHRIFRW